MALAVKRNSGEDLHGAQGRNRTTDTAIFSRMLYQLSYLGAACRLAQPRAAIKSAPHPFPRRREAAIPRAFRARSASGAMAGEFR